jgi:integrase
MISHMIFRQAECLSNPPVGGSIEMGLKGWLTVQNLGKKPRTRQFNEEIIATIRKHLPDLERQSERITQEEVTDFCTKVDGYCPSRWNAMLSAMKSLTAHAKILKRKKIRFRSFIPPTKDQFARLLEECDKLPRSHAGHIVRFMVLTGLRICEARALRWEHVNCARIYVPSSVSKNGVGRSIPFLPGVAETVAKLKAVSPDKVLPKDSFRTGLKKACERAGIASLSYHCFRHMFATNCIEAGVDLPTVARWLGHSDGGALLARMYFHLLDGHSLEMAKRVTVTIG